MDKFDLSKNKYYIILGIIFITFVFAICQAFNYLPANVSEKSLFGEKMTLPENNETIANEEDNYNTRQTDDENDDEDDEADDNAKENNSVPTEQISEEQDEVYDKYQDCVDKGEKYLTKAEYQNAVEAYQKAAELTSNPNDKAFCYEKTSISYANLHRYGTALSFAQKSYNLSPTTSREVLLARLYYKIGDYNKANQRINNVLKREFSEDR